MINKATIDLIKKYEGLKLVSYLCPANVWTIGYGTTIYPNGSKVKQGDICTQLQAEEYLQSDLNIFSNQVGKLIKSAINSNQYGAIISFTYNLGIGSLSKSTLLKKVNSNPSDKSISLEFMKWVNANGKPLQGLINRRKEESKLYFS